MESQNNMFKILSFKNDMPSLISWCQLCEGLVLQHSGLHKVDREINNLQKPGMPSFLRKMRMANV